MQTPGFAPATTDGSFFDLRDYVQVVQRRRKLILVLAAIAVALALVWTRLQTPVYTATAELLVREPLADAAAVVPSEPLNIENERQIMTSLPVADIARDHIDLDDTSRQLLTRIAVTVPKDADVLQIQFQHTDPQIAAQGAQAFANAYIEFKTERARAIIKDQVDDFETRIAQLKTEQQANPQVNASTIAALEAQKLSVSSSPIDPGEILVDAEPPAGASSPNLVLNVVLALLLGLFVGLVAAFIRERVDDRLRGRADLEATTGVPVMTMIPAVPSWRDRTAPYLVTLELPRSSAAEAYRTLRTSILVAAAQSGTKTLMVVSAVAGEGKTTTASNLAVTLAQADKRVVLISADLRRPRIHEFFGLGSADRGLSEVLGGDRRAWESMRSGKVDNLWIMSSGKASEQPTELLQSEAMRELLADQREVVDFIIIDCPPVLAVADSLVLAPMVDAVLFVADAQSTPRGAVIAARAQLDQVGARILGAVLNGVEGTGGYSYYGQYAYEPKPEDLVRPQTNGSKPGLWEHLRKERFPG
jgi:succinoglycan biosynthesis transport protein ExoP